MRGKLVNGVYTKYESEAQKLKMAGGAWSINLQELPAEAKVIEYITAIDNYVISREDAFSKGFVRMLGGEEKLIVPLKYWQKGSVAVDE